MRDLAAYEYESKGACMKNFQFLFAAWMTVWAVFFVYEVSIARRLSKLREEVDRVKQQVREGSLEGPSVAGFDIANNPGSCICAPGRIAVFLCFT